MKSCRDRSHASLPDLTPVNLDCAFKYASSVELAPSIPGVPPYGLRELQQNFEKSRRENFSLKVEVCFLKSKLQELGYFSELPENQLVDELETFKKFLNNELNAENKIRNESDICQKVELVEVSKSIAVKEKELEKVKDENAHLKSVIVSLRKENELLLESLQNAGESVYESDNSGRISLMTRKDALIFKLKSRIVELEMDLMKHTSISGRLEEKEFQDVVSDSNLKIPETLHVATQTSFIQESPACSSVSTVDHTSREEAQPSSEMRLICNYLDEVSTKAEYIFFVLKKIVGSSKNVNLLSELDRKLELNALNFPVLFDNLCTMLDGSIYILDCSNDNNNNNGKDLHYYLNSLDEQSDRHFFEDEIHHLKEQVKHLQWLLCEKEKFIANMMKRNSRITRATFHSSQSKGHEVERFNEVLFDLNKSLANIRNSNALMASRLKLTDGAIAVLMENKLSKIHSQTLKKTLQRNVDASDETDVKVLNAHLKVQRDSCYERKTHNKCKNYIIRE
ncbi:Endosome-associated-trafficking regulator [Trichinella pseudospiralis]